MRKNINDNAYRKACGGVKKELSDAANPGGIKQATKMAQAAAGENRTSPSPSRSRSPAKKHNFKEAQTPKAKFLATSLDEQIDQCPFGVMCHWGPKCRNYHSPEQIADILERKRLEREANRKGKGNGKGAPVELPEVTPKGKGKTKSKDQLANSPKGKGKKSRGADKGGKVKEVTTLEKASEITTKIMKI